MTTMMGIYQISISPEADPTEFEERVRTQVFPTVSVGHQTRGGIVTAQYLWKSDSPEAGHDYSWIVHWENQGGSPFGSANAPADPAEELTEFEARTNFSRYILEGDERSSEA